MGLLAASLLGCIRSASQIAGVDLRRLEQDDRLLLIGKVQVLRGRDLTARVAIETDDAALGGYQLDASGIVAWVVRRPTRPLYLAWLSSDQLNAGQEQADGAVGLAHDPRLQLAPASAATRIVYFGTIVIDLGTRQPAGLEQVAGVSQHKTSIEVRDEAQVTLERVLALNPTVAGLDYFSLPAGEVRHAGVR